MKIGIIGAGNVGTALARRLVGGHDVSLAFSLDLAKLKAAAREIGAWPTEPATAAATADVVVLATPWTATETALRAAGDLSGKLIWDCTNPMKLDMSGLMLGTETSGGEQVAAWVGPKARVVKAIPPFAELMARTGPLTLSNGRAPSVFVCGDDPQARTAIAALVREIGAEPTEAGPLRNARFAEPAGMLLVQLAYLQGMGAAIGLSLLRAEEE